jgi:hypothetical protein
MTCGWRPKCDDSKSKHHRALGYYLGMIASEKASSRALRWRGLSGADHVAAADASAIELRLCVQTDFKIT